MSQLEEFYNVVTYPAFAYASTHPSRLATVAMLHGMQPADVQHCRVLEIGCNAGANLIPMAYTLPHSEFVGFDLAGEPVARGVETIRELGLTNIQLFQADLLQAEDLPALEGKFDYIIAHGLYAWVPEPVRDGLLALCRRRLSENGIAFISYNALPGGYVRSIVRDILLAPPTATPQDLLATTNSSIDFLKFVVSCRPDGDVFRIMLQSELEGIEKRTASVVIHDEMTPAFRPVGIPEFARHASQHQLQYLGEAGFVSATDPSCNAEIVAKVTAYAKGDPITREYMFDLIRMRMYRETLLCHADVNVSYDLHPDGLHRLEFQATATSIPGSKADSRVYTSQNGMRIESQHPATVAVLEQLIAIAPQSASFAAITQALQAKGIAVDASLPILLMQLILSRMILPHSWHAPVAHAASERPFASQVARHAALHGLQATTLLHTTADLTDPIVRQLVPLLDGTRDRADLLRELTQRMPATSPAEIQNGLEGALKFLAEAGILETQHTN